jgi:hypothetical protein
LHVARTYRASPNAEQEQRRLRPRNARTERSRAPSWPSGSRLDLDELAYAVLRISYGGISCVDF